MVRPAWPTPAGRGRCVPSRRRRYCLLTRRDKLVLGLDGRDPGASSSSSSLGPDDRLDRPVVHELERDRRPSTRSSSSGIENYVNLFTRLPAVLAGPPHNLIWLVFLCSSRRRSASSSRSCSTRTSAARASTRARSTCRSSCRSRSSASSGSSSTRRSKGFINNVARHDTAPDNPSAGWGTRTSTSWAVLVAASWRHVGYMMVLYLAGLKSVDPSLREAAAIDGAIERQTFFRVVFPVMTPDQRRDPGHHDHRVAARVRHRLHHQQGPERPRAAVDADHQQHRSASRAGSGSDRRSRSSCCVISVGPIIVFLTRTMRRSRDDRARGRRRCPRAAASDRRRRGSGCARVALHAFLIAHGR